jgi:hypothetical protein
MLTDDEIRNEYFDNYRYSHDYWMPFVKDAQVYTLAASGYTWSDEERRQLIASGREPIEYNIIRRPLQFFSGYLRDNINQIVYSPVEGSDKKTADQFTKLSYYVWDKGFGYPTFLDSADEAFKSGISLTGIQMDYSKDFINGDISFFYRTYNSFYLDPTFTKINLADCGYAITRDLLGKEYLKQLLPFVDPKEIDQISRGFRDNKFLQYRPEFTAVSKNRNIIAYDQYYKRITKRRKFLVDIETSFYRDITDLPKDDIDRLKIGIRRFQKMREESDGNNIDIPNIEIQTVDRGFVELNIMLNGERFYCGEDKTGINQTYPFVPNICYLEPSIWMPSQRIQGIASCNWSLQRQFNKRHMKITDMMDSSISTGYKYLLGTVPDVSDLQQAGQNKIVGIDPENNPAGLDAVQELRGGNANGDLIAYQEILDKLSLTLSNVNESSMGIDEKGNTQISGRLAEVRIAQGLRGNRKIMDNIETAQQVLGGLILTCIQKKMPVGKVERILGEKPTEQFYESEFEQYDAVVKEGVRSKSQRDAYYYELVNLKREGIVDVPQNAIVKALSMAGITDLEEEIAAQDEMLAKQKAIADEVQQKTIEKLDSETEANLGLAQERKSRVISNLSLKDERESEAQENMANAALERARAMTEISKLNEDRIIQVLNVINELEKQEAIGREIQKQQVGQEAHQINMETEGSAENQQQQAMMQEQQSQMQQMQEFSKGG